MADGLAKGIMVIGTDTEIGKTYVTQGLVSQLREQGQQVAAMKPVACGMTEIDGRWQNEDVEILCPPNTDEQGRQLCNPYCFKPPISPHLAAREAGVAIDLDHVLACYHQLARQADWVVVESAGGLMTPLTGEQTFLDLTRLLAQPVLLVVGMRLGCINHSLLTVSALQQAGVPLIGWVANYPQPGEPDADLESTLQQQIPAPRLAVVGYKKQPRFDLDQ